MDVIAGIVTFTDNWISRLTPSTFLYDSSNEIVKSAISGFSLNDQHYHLIGIQFRPIIHSWCASYGVREQE